MNNIENFKKFLKKMGLEANIVNGNEDRKIKKSIPAKTEWIAMQDEMDILLKEIENRELKVKALKNKFWGIVHIDLNIFDSLRYNPKSKEIEVLVDEDEETTKDGSIPSPFQKKDL